MIFITAIFSFTCYITLMNKTEVDEKILVQGAQQGDRSALAELVGLYERRIYYLALRMMGNEQDAEDMLQETFLIVVKKISQFKGNSSFYTWLYRIAVNEGLRIINSKHNSKNHVSIDDPDMDAVNNEHMKEWPKLDFSHISEKRLRKQLDTALKELPDLYRTVFILRDLHGLSTEETSNILQLTQSNTKVRLMRARNF